MDLDRRAGADTRGLAIADLAHLPDEGSPVAADATVPTPALVVDLDPAADPDTVRRASRRAAECGRLTIGRYAGPAAELDALAGLLEALDVTYVRDDEPAHRTVVGVDDVDGAVAETVACVTRNPHAALVAAQVVRASEALPVEAAIDVESFAYSALQGGPEYRRWLDSRGPRPLPPLVDHAVLVDRDGGLLRVTLNRPERRNAYGRQLRDGWADALRIALADDTVTAVVVDGAGPSFCAGGDLDEFGTTPDTATAHLVRTRDGVGRYVARLAGRTEVRLHGHCVGGGIEISAFAGRVVAAPDTVMRLPEVGMGLIPGAGGTVSLPRRIGRHRSLHLFVTGRPIGAQQARTWGLVDAIVD